MEIHVEHDASRGRFHASVQGHRCLCDYRLRDGVMHITHTEVPPELEGRGIAGELVRSAMAHARESGWKVRPSCSYAAAWVRRHPEVQDLLA